MIKKKEYIIQWSIIFLNYMKKKYTDYLFFDWIRDRKGAREKIEKTISDFMKKKLKISNDKIKEFNALANEERAVLRYGSTIKLLFDPFIRLIKYDPL